MKIYISMPLHGHTEEDARKRAERAKNYVAEVIQRGLRDTLKEMGTETRAPFTVETPFDVAERLDYNNTHGNDRRRLLDVDYILEDLKSVSQSNLVIVLDGWSESRGCLAEVAFAKSRGIEVLLMSENLMSCGRVGLGGLFDYAEIMHCSRVVSDAFRNVFYEYVRAKQKLCPMQKSLNQYPIDDLPF